MTEKAPAAAAATRVSGLIPDLAAASHQTAILRGILLMCAGVSLFPFMNAAVKLLGARYPANEIVWARFTGHLIVMLAVFLPQYGWRLLRDAATGGADRPRPVDADRQRAVRHRDRLMCRSRPLRRSGLPRR